VVGVDYLGSWWVSAWLSVGYWVLSENNLSRYTINGLNYVLHIGWRETLWLRISPTKHMHLVSFLFALNLFALVYLLLFFHFEVVEHIDFISVFLEDKVGTWVTGRFICFLLSFFSFVSNNNCSIVSSKDSLTCALSVFSWLFKLMNFQLWRKQRLIQLVWNIMLLHFNMII